MSRACSLPACKAGGSVTRTLHASTHHFLRHCLAVAGQPDDVHQVDEERGRVEPPAVLAGRVVGREDVVVVVVALAARREGDAEVLGGVDPSVVRSVAPQVRHAVDGPRHVEHGHVAQDSAREERRPAALGPVVIRHDGRQHEAQHDHRRHVQSTTTQRLLRHDRLQATFSKLPTYCVLRSTQPPTLSRTGNE